MRTRFQDSFGFLTPGQISPRDAVWDEGGTPYQVFSVDLALDRPRIVLIPRKGGPRQTWEAAGPDEVEFTRVT
jgi:hypothetical protein